MCFEVKQASYPAAATAPYYSRRVNAGVVRQIGMIVFEPAPANNNFIFFAGKMPQFYSDNGIDVYIHWTISAAEGGVTAIWGAAFEKIDSSLLITADGFDTANTVSGLTPAPTDAVKITTIEFANSEIDDLEAGDSFRLKIYRDTDADNYGSNTQLHMIELREGL